MKRSRTTLYLLFTDWLILVGSFAVALHYRQYAPGLNIVSRYHLIPEMSMMLIYALMMLFIFSAFGLYKRKTMLSSLQHIIGITKASLATILIYLLAKSLVKSDVFIPSRFVLLLWGMIFFPALTFHRTLVVRMLFNLLSKTDMRRRVVVIGDTDLAKLFIDECRKKENCGMNIVGVMEETEKAEVVTSVPFIGCPSSLPEVINLYNLEGAVICNPTFSYQQLMDMVEDCVRFFGWVDIHSDKSAVLHDNLDTDTYFDIPFVRMYGLPNNLLFKSWKRSFDFVAALVGILLLSPILIATAIAIKATSPGPILYKSRRIGFQGKDFNFYKFRSMHTGADQDPTRGDAVSAFIKSGDSTIEGAKIVNTAYVTPVGKFIRKWAIDELPQLFNVLKGEMALVGPRPVPQNEYEASDRWQKKRFDIVPGCTGLWKVNAARHGCAFNHTVLYDIYYSRNMSPMMDLYVILNTIKLILVGKADA